MFAHGATGGWDELAIAVAALAVLWVAVKLAGRKSANDEDDPDAEPPGDTDTGTDEGKQAAPERGRESGMVTVAICPVSGKRATSHCPETELRSFKRGTEPREFCTFHR